MSTYVPVTGLTAYVATSSTEFPTSIEDHVELRALTVIASCMVTDGYDAGTGELVVVNDRGVVRPLSDEADTGDSTLVGVLPAPPEDGWQELTLKRLQNKAFAGLIEEMEQATTRDEVKVALADAEKWGVANDYAYSVADKALTRLIGVVA